MPTVLDIEHMLDGEIIVRDQHVGDIRCKKLTITRTGSVKGNILCKHLQVGGYVEGIAVCHILEGNNQGTLHGSLYYTTKKDEAKVAGIVDYREPPGSVWAVVMPERNDNSTLLPVDKHEATIEELSEFGAEEIVQEPFGETASDLPMTHSSADVASSDNGSICMSDEIEFGSAPIPSPPSAEGGVTSSKFFPTPVGVVDSLKKPGDPRADFAWVSTGRKVSLDARFF